MDNEDNSNIEHGVLAFANNIIPPATTFSITTNGMDETITTHKSMVLQISPGTEITKGGTTVRVNGNAILNVEGNNEPLILYSNNVTPVTDDPDQITISGEFNQNLLDLVINPEG